MTEPWELGDDPAELARLGAALEAKGDWHLAAAAYDRAYGLAPRDPDISARRTRLLDSLAVVDGGLEWRFIPAGRRVIGCDGGEPDEGPAHEVIVDGFWMLRTPVTWSDYCRLLGWSEPPKGMPPDRPPAQQGPYFFVAEANRIRLQYCETETVQASDWHAHAPAGQMLFPSPHRIRPERPFRYDSKPMISVGWQDAEELATAMTSMPELSYRLPTEAEWEVAARGGLIGARYTWGDEPPTLDNCDFGRFDDLSIMPPLIQPPNGYGLYGMCGGVWEWTSDWYDSQYYAHSPVDNPTGPGSGVEKVIRGGSWCDPAEVVTVSFRASRASAGWREERWGKQMTPNIGFRLCRVESG
jgi:formylglycine-generating enzyme required for sulfatase activity